MGTIIMDKNLRRKLLKAIQEDIERGDGEATEFNEELNKAGFDLPSEAIDDLKGELEAVKKFLEELGKIHPPFDIRPFVPVGW